MMKMGIGGALLVVAALAAPAAAQDRGTDEAAVQRAAMDYLDAFYMGDEAKLRRGVHPDVTKYGFMSGDDMKYNGEPMSFQEMIDYVAGVRTSGRQPPATAPKEVLVLDVMDQTAAVRINAWWGSDYMHLAKYDGQWQIIHVLWQTPPKH